MLFGLLVFNEFGISVASVFSTEDKRVGLVSALIDLVCFDWVSSLSTLKSFLSLIS
jgi:hypothetical protein